MSLQILYLHYILYILSRFYINCMCSNGAKCNNCSKRKNLTSIISKMFWINYAFVEINYMYIQLQMPCMHGSSSSIIELLRESTIYTDDIHERKLYHHGDGSFASFNCIENRSNCWLIDQLLTKFSPIIDNYRTKKWQWFYILQVDNANALVASVYSGQNPKHRVRPDLYMGPRSQQGVCVRHRVNRASHTVHYPSLLLCQSPHCGPTTAEKSCRPSTINQSNTQRRKRGCQRPISAREYHVWSENNRAVSVTKRWIRSWSSNH